MELHDIGWAVNQMREGLAVYRRGWNGQGQFLEIKWPTAGQKCNVPYVYIVTTQGDVVPWLCSQSDLLADDWERSSGPPSASGSR